ncbi:MAG TPA: dihydrofolate reductase family protein [Aggregatilineales bacterium]|nr:dihydrofolate reductase family protein [Aggregatilineales bacterium]
MRPVVVWEFMSLDGVMEAPEKWVFPYQSEDVAEAIKAQNLASDVLVLGRVTFETFASAWPKMTHNEFGFADKLNNQPKFVVSSTLQKAEWNNSMIINDHVIETINALKQQPGGEIGITGSATLVQSLLKANLVDELRLFVHPIVLGSGKRLFADGNHVTLKHVKVQPFSSGVVLLYYQFGNK